MQGIQFLVNIWKSLLNIILQTFQFCRLQFQQQYCTMDNNDELREHNVDDGENSNESSSESDDVNNADLRAVHFIIHSRLNQF